MDETVTYMTEEQVIMLRRGFAEYHVKNEYISKGTLRYIMESVKDLFNDLPLREALVRKAAYLLYRIIAQHPFLDGNKRTGFGVADAFLRLNDRKILADPDEIVKLALSIAEGKVSEDDVYRWLSQHLRNTMESEG